MRSAPWKPGPLIIERPVRRMMKMARKLGSGTFHSVLKLKHEAKRLPRWKLERAYWRLSREYEHGQRFA